MKNLTEAAVSFPIRIASPSGLSVELNANGSIRRMDHGDIMLNVFLANEVEGGPANIYLRLHEGAQVTSIPLLGPASPASYHIHERGMVATGVWGDLVFRLRLLLAESAPVWFWHVELENTGTQAVTCDLILAQDLSLAHYGAVRLNEYYVSQYVDHTPLDHPHCGLAVASRQNQSMGGRCPWALIASMGRGVAFATDALQFHGLATRAGAEPRGLTDGLPSKRQQHEHSMVSIQDERFTLGSNAKSQRGFLGCFVPDKPTATSAADVGVIAGALALPEAIAPPWPKDAAPMRPVASLFSTAELLASSDLDAGQIRGLFRAPTRHVEWEDGCEQSFFTAEGSHVVMKAKERRVLRPHGHLLRTGGMLTPDESALTTTVWMNGVFHSMVTQGHVSINRFLSTCHSYLGLFRSHGQRVFVELDGAWKLLDMPSAFEMALDSSRWIYKHPGGMIEVVATAPDNRHALGLTITALGGPPVRFLTTYHVAINGDDGSTATPLCWKGDASSVRITAACESDVGRRFPNRDFAITATPGTVIESISGDEGIFADGVSRAQPFLCFVTAPTLTAGWVIEGHLVDAPEPPAGRMWKDIMHGMQITAPPMSALAPAATRIAEIMPWFIHNALVHYLSPRGLEQYSGGGWGTRDVCQGPVELLLSLGHFVPVRDLLCRVFRQQNADGDWPQWFMFFDRERNIRPDDSHGDIVYWPVLALAQYLCATGDAGLLDEPLPFYHAAGDAAAETRTLWEHVERALTVMRSRVINGTHLAAYGHGDWNDSLQPARPDMREQLCSSWTVTLNYQTFTTMGRAFRRLGQTARALEFEAMAGHILDEFQRVLITDDVVAGLVHFHDDGTHEHLLHPRDGTT
ncbi:MAG: hypothetical protein RLZZ282_1225, partial [Verrucomicrobiota bacterium]